MRFQVTFWLNTDKKNEALLYDTLCELKEQRNFSKTIRDGLYLILDLRAGNTTVLEELFPQFLDKYLAKHMLTNVTAVEPTMPAQVADRSAQDLGEDDTLTFTITTATSKENPTYNIMLSMAKLNDSLADLPTKVLEYGIKNEKIPESMQKIIDERSSSRAVIPIVEQKSSGGPKPLKGGAIKFEAPPDDIELDFGL